MSEMSKGLIFEWLGICVATISNKDVVWLQRAHTSYSQCFLMSRLPRRLRTICSLHWKRWKQVWLITNKSRSNSSWRVKMIESTRRLKVAAIWWVSAERSGSISCRDESERKLLKCRLHWKQQSTFELKSLSWGVSECQSTTTAFMHLGNKNYHNSVFLLLSALGRYKWWSWKTCKNSPRLSKRLHCCVGGQRADQTDDLCQDGRQQEVWGRFSCALLNGGATWE